MDKKNIYSAKAPEPVGPYSQAVQAGRFVYVSGQIPLNPDSGELVLGNINDQARQVLTNLRAVLAAAGCSLVDVVKTTVYLTDLNLFPPLNEVYGTFFTQDPPARACVGVSSLPKGVGIEIEAVAVKKSL